MEQNRKIKHISNVRVKVIEYDDGSVRTEGINLEDCSQIGLGSALEMITDFLIEREYARRTRSVIGKFIRFIVR